MLVTATIVVVVVVVVEIVFTIVVPVIKNRTSNGYEVRRLTSIPIT